MIRKPISTRLRIGLGLSSILLMLLSYTWVAGSRQRTKMREQQAAAIEQLETLSKIQNPTDRQRAQIERLSEQRDNPDAIDKTVPTWGVLYEMGFKRAFSEQGSFKRKEIWFLVDFKTSLLRLVTALVIGLSMSLLVGLLMGCYDPVDAFFQPSFAFLSKIPATAVLPLFFALVGIDFKMYLVMIVFAMLPGLAQTISMNVRKDVPEELIFKAYTLGASQVELIVEVIFRQVLPRMIDAARAQIGPALILLVAAEWMAGGDEGIGYRLRLFYQRTDMTVVYVYVVILGLFGLAADYGLLWLRRKLCPWFGN